MIIKLKGANFSTNNINALLNSYFVSIAGGSCVTAANNISSVSKDSPTYSNTFTVNTDYSVSNVEVTMGGTNITSTAVDKTSGEAGTVITISNLTVTNNLSIKFTYTYNGVEEPDTPGSGDVVDPETPTVTQYMFKDQTNIGYLSGGSYVESAKAATTDYIDISSKPKIGYYGRMGYIEGDTFHALEFFDANKTYLADLSVLGTGVPMQTNIDLSESKYANAKYVRASVSQSSYSQEEFDKWYFIVGDFADSVPTLDTVVSMFPISGYIGTNGTIVEASSNAYATDYVSLSGKTNIEYKGRMGTIGLNMAFYDSSKNLISGLETIGDGNFITLNVDLSDSNYSNAAYVRASISRGTLDETTWLSSSFKIS